MTSTVRIRFTKLGKVRFLSHRDLARILERALRKVELPVLYSAGFSPRPKVHFGLALSVGQESVAEFLDVDLATEPDEPLDALASRLGHALPDGIDVTGALLLDDGPRLSLQQAVTSCSWSFEVEGGTPAEAAAAVDAVLAAPELVVTRQRKGKSVTDDIRPYIRHLQVDPDGPTGPDGVALLAELGTQPRSLRPAELIDALGPPWRDRRMRRLTQWIEHDGTRLEPDARSFGRMPSAHAEAYAS